MLDILDLLNARENQVFSGTYYDGMPKTAQDSGITFDYEYVDPTAWHYQSLFSQVIVKDSTSSAIKTKMDLHYKVGAYIATQDGRFYEIIAVQQDYQSASKNAFRNLAQVAGVEFVIRMSEKSNPWGLR